jgi:two-component system cell cycle response regulator
MKTIENAKILVVDDEPMIIQFYEAALGEQGYHVATAIDGRQALEKTREFQPDVILLDVVMPELNGFQVTERLKADSATAGIPIILVTGLGSIEDRVKGLEAGADDFLGKPFNLDELLVRVRSLVKLKKLQDRLKQAEAASPLPTSPAVTPMPTPFEPRRQPVILVVEDDERIIKICATVLGTGGYQVVSAPDGAGMFVAIEREAPDLIILDLMLPGMDGVEILAKIKEMPLARDVPVIILTAIGDLKTKVKTLYIGADDYLVKPVSSLELLARVRANLRKHDYERRLKYQLDQSFVESITDPLTGLYNRRYLESTLERELALHRRNGQPLCLLMLDIDGFKAINDAHGHPAGDAVLSELAAIFKIELRTSDLAVRMGGDEFLVVLPDARMEQAAAIAERLRGAVAMLAIPALGSEHPTVSIGVCQAGDEEGGMAALLKKADEALYRAKTEGKNRVAV